MKPKVTSQLVALSSAAILAVYTAGYMRTRAAAARIAGAAERPRPAIAGPVDAGAPVPAASPAPAAIPAEPPPAPPATDVKTAAPSRATARPKRAVRSVSQTATAAPGPTPLPPAPTPPAAEDPKPPSPIPVVTPPPVTTAAPAAGSAPANPAAPVYKDGTYTGWGTSRHGDIQATVVIEGGKILSATISQCLTRYSCSVIDKLPPQVAGRQSPEVDYVSGATQSTNAFYYAVVEALSKAK